MRYAGFVIPDTVNKVYAIQNIRKLYELYRQRENSVLISQQQVYNSAAQEIINEFIKLGVTLTDTKNPLDTPGPPVRY